MKKIIIGVMGPGKEATKKDIENAFKVGELIAAQGWIVLTGGMKQGVMDAVNKGAKKNNGLTVGILPNDDSATHSEYLDIPIITNMRAGRNYINALSCDIMVVCGMSAGTSSEISHAIQAKKSIILLDVDNEGRSFFQKLGKDLIHTANSPQDVIYLINKKLLRGGEI